MNGKKSFNLGRRKQTLSKAAIKNVQSNSKSRNTLVTDDPYAESFNIQPLKNKPYHRLIKLIKN